MIEFTGRYTKTKYFIHPDVISSMHEFDGGTVLYTDRVENGSTLGYHVDASVEEVLTLLQMSTQHG